jgi:hypothetical protein
MIIYEVEKSSFSTTVSWRLTPAKNKQLLDMTATR